MPASLIRFRGFGVIPRQRDTSPGRSAIPEPSAKRNVDKHTPSKQGSHAMDWNRVEGNWKQMKGKVKEQWGRLTDDDLDMIAGKREQLEGKIQERYGVARDQVQKDIDDWYGSQKW
jgi:uncharacterized protein YjbJ (UPF0337 family)